MNYGFCGNAWIEAQEVMLLNRIKLFFIEVEYVKAVKLLRRQPFYLNPIMIHIQVTVAQPLNRIKNNPD